MRAMWHGLALSTKVGVAAAVLGTGVAAAAVVPTLIRKDPTPTARDVLARRLVEADADARRHIRDYADWLDTHRLAHPGSLPCPQELRALADDTTNGYTFLSFDGDRDADLSDGTDDTKVALYHATPRELADAGDVAFFVPGMATTWSNGFESVGQETLGRTGVVCRSTMKVKATNWIASANLIQTNARSRRNASTPPVVVAWLGYNSPKDTLSSGDYFDDDGPGNSTYADHGGEALARDVDRYTLDEQHTTLVAHSYGSLVAGYSLWRYHASHVDDVVTAGSPGMGVALDYGYTGPPLVTDRAERCRGDYVRECMPQVHAAHFWSLRTPHDQLSGEDGFCPEGCGWTGAPPHTEEFGANILAANHDGYPVVDEHGDYFSLGKVEKGKAPMTVVNAALVVDGRYDQLDIERRAPDVRDAKNAHRVDWKNQRYDLSACLPDAEGASSVQLRDGKAGAPADVVYSLDAALPLSDGRTVLLFQCAAGNYSDGLAAVVSPDRTAPVRFDTTAHVSGGVGWSSAAGPPASASATSAFHFLDLSRQRFVWSLPAPMGAPSEYRELDVFGVEGKAIEQRSTRYVFHRTDDEAASMRAAQRACDTFAAHLDFAHAGGGFYLFRVGFGTLLAKEFSAESPWYRVTSSGLEPYRPLVDDRDQATPVGSYDVYDGEVDGEHWCLTDAATRAWVGEGDV